MELWKAKSPKPGEKGSSEGPKGEGSIDRRQ